MKLIDPIGLKQALVVSAILDGKKTIEQIIDEQPTIEERKKGEWIDGSVQSYYVCSECAYQERFANENNYCPNCGADMRGERDE